MDQKKSPEYDVIIIGAGVIGSAIAREISRYELKIGVLEKELDVCSETSGRNSGVLHAGFNNEPGSLMAKYCVEGCLGFDKVAEELDIPFSRTGKIVVGFDAEDKDKLIRLKEQGDQNGVPGLEIIGKERIKELAPYVDGEFAMYSPATGVLNPFIYTIALAENAHHNGVDFFFNNEVIAIKHLENTSKNEINSEKSYEIKTTQGCYATKWVINCAGLNADKIARMLGINDYTIYPCRGEYFILDKKAGEFLKLPAYPVPNTKEGGLGIHLTPTIDGNILIGPSTEYIEERDNYSSTQEIMDLLIKDGGRIFPYLKREFFIRNFAGIRPKLVNKDVGGYADFVIEAREEAPHTILLIGMESPGLTSAVPIARRVIEMMSEKEYLIEKVNYDPYRKGILCFNEQPLEKKRKLIQQNSNYGEIICRCETITKAEILEAIHNPLGVETVIGIKNRTRAMMGRCQGGYCETRISEILMQEKDKPENEVIYARQGGKMFVGKVRD
ncbi:MAG: FAD/NAD(P)-binding oxidoreductase [Gracilibacter sp. BRH_c7a]|nr:MAG: FAD/NAD(P)-binding oxidoreductase [Gracilibacter sp. BRH_c7a]